MFKKATKLDIDQQTITGIISEGSVIQGSLNAPAFVRIDGQINGDVTIEQGLILGEKGKVTGHIITKQLVVYGYIEGNITAEVLEIRNTGNINGNIKTGTIQVEAGAVYNGTLSME